VEYRPRRPPGPGSLCGPASPPTAVGVVRSSPARADRPRESPCGVLSDTPTYPSSVGRGRVAPTPPGGRGHLPRRQKDSGRSRWTARPGEESGGAGEKRAARFAADHSWVPRQARGARTFPAGAHKSPTGAGRPRGGKRTMVTQEAVGRLRSVGREPRGIPPCRPRPPTCLSLLRRRRGPPGAAWLPPGCCLGLGQPPAAVLRRRADRAGGVPSRPRRWDGGRGSTHPGARPVRPGPPARPHAGGHPARYPLRADTPRSGREERLPRREALADVNSARRPLPAVRSPLRVRVHGPKATEVEGLGTLAVPRTRCGRANRAGPTTQRQPTKPFAKDRKDLRRKCPPMPRSMWRMALDSSATAWRKMT
jgi:hypothetical protein